MRPVTTDPHATDSGLDALASLGDGRRRRLYRYVVGRGEPATRDEAAAATGMTRAMAAYHLDKLVSSGLLDVRFERRTGRRGPGAGRPSKLYLRPAEAVEVSLPKRDYAAIARLLAHAVEADTSGVAGRAVVDAARALGSDVASAGGRPSLTEVLVGAGYEPYLDGGTIRMRNCPFSELARRHRELVCGANLALVEGMLAAIGPAAGRAALDPGDDRCCVAVATA
jgi:predicted ArsR family transcriptional regulator